MRISFISVSQNVFFLKKPTINVRALMSLQTSESWKSAIFKILKKHSFSVMTPKKKKRKKLEKFRNRNRFWLRWREKGEKRKIKQELTVLSAHHVHIANLVMHFGMKPFPLKSLPRKYGQSSWNKTDSKHRRVFTSIQISQGNLNKVLPIASIKQKVIFSMEDIASNPKGYIDWKKSEICEANATALTYIFTRSQSATAVYAQQRQWRAWLEFIQLHFL